jgi:hypothetical protein
MQVLINDLSFSLKNEEPSYDVVNVYDFQTEQALDFTISKEIANEYRAIDGSFTEQSFAELCSDQLKHLSEHWFEGNIFFNEDGNPIDSQGNLRDENLNIIDEDGNIILE